MRYLRRIALAILRGVVPPAVRSGRYPAPELEAAPETIHWSRGGPGLVFRLMLAILTLGIAVALLVRMARWIGHEAVAVFSSLM
jgi:hypothetical protein